MKKAFLVFALTMVFWTVAAQAGTIVLTFEGLQNNEQVLNYYNGGLGGNGSGPGPNYGIVFGSDSLAIISEAAGGTGNFDGAPSMPTVLYFLSGPGDVMNVAAGFTTGFSFFYSSPFATGSVTVYSGLNDTGTVLASLSLPSTPNGTTFGPPCSGLYNYCPWIPVGVSFSGTAMSVDFSGTANFIAFDNVTLGSSTPGTPEPGTLVMFGSGVVGLAGLLRRRFNV
jgi:PEP-CTERM motif